MPSIFFYFFFFENDIFTLSPSSSSSNYKIAIVINTTTTMNNQIEALNAPKIDLPFFFFHSFIKANDYGSVRQTTYLGSRLAVDDLPFSRLAVDDLPGSRLVNAEKFDFPRRLTFQSRRLNFQSSEITDFKVNCKNNLCVDQTTYNHKQNYYRSFIYKDKLGFHLSRQDQTTFKKSRRLLRSPDDFQEEVQTTFRKSRRLPDDFQMTSRRLTSKSSQKFPDLKNLHIKSRSEKPAYSKTHKNLPKRSEKSRRLPRSPDDFLEVQTTSWKSRRLPGSPDDFLEVQTTLSEDFQEVQTTSRRLTGKSSQKSSRSEKPAHQIQI
ncbi:hypothetical protein IGI04_026666 [Brassica rapa subsp. trilocularis]|uniref:TPX2 central domain-containing protein n=1 Tax=Brassica rapa subsp. trilocularis TaxID=1813537 RepID=A0ABQ7KZS4_BRACM|nr:hypothetical protein IGI04_026666 [Brassica rapa subsp. trilocularis]